MPNPTPGKELISDQVHNCECDGTTGNLAILSCIYGTFVASSACTYCTWARGNDNDEQKVNGIDSVTRAYGLLYVILLAKGSNHSLHEFVVSHSWTELLQILYW